MLTEILMQTETEPYPGLRAFTAEESHLFFGRDMQIDKLLEKLDHSHFVAVVGPSGCGKSSLVKAGLVPALKTGFFLNSGTKWRIAEMRPGNDPYKNLATTLLKSFDDDNNTDCLKAELKRSPKGLLNVIKSESLYKKENFLLIVDQFEELFRYKQNDNIDEVTGFINLLIESATQQQIPVHVIITMRSDFLGQCSLFLKLPEILNDNQFLTPRLTREQTKEAIEGPASVCGGSIEPKLVNNLLNDIGIDHDQLPLLQHALMRMWIFAKQKSIPASINNSLNNTSFELNKDSFVLTLDDYNKTGKLSEALSQHANEIFDDELNEKQKKIAEILFKRLSERNAEQKDNRRLATVEDIAAVAKVSVDDVIKVADIFRASENSFLMPPPEVKLGAQSFLDISHESLLRRWDKMKIWIEKEYADATEFKKLAEDANDYFKESGELLTGIKLTNVVKWKDQKDINEEWALRYSDNYKEAEYYIRKSKIKSRKKNALLTAAVCISIFSVIAALSFVVYNKAMAQKKIDAININNEINRKIDSTKTQAARQKEIDFINIQSKTQRKIDSANAEIAVRRKIDSANVQRTIELAKIQVDARRKIDSVNSIFNRLHEILELVNEPFYKSDIFDSSQKNNYVDRLVKLQYKDQNFTDLKRLRDSLNTVSDIYDIAQRNPNQALLKAAFLNHASKNNYYDSLLYYVANNYAFYNKRIFFPRSYYNDRNHPKPVVSKKRKFLGAVTEDSINIYRIINDSLASLKTIPLQKNSSAINTIYNNTSGPGTMMFINENKLIAFDNNLIYNVNINDSSETIAQLPNFSQKSVNERYYTSTISEDGKKLAIDYRNYNVKIWDIDSLNEAPLLIKLDSLNGYVSNIKFSFNNEKIIVKQNYGYVVKSLNDNSDTTFEHLDITPDNRYAIVQREGVFELQNIDSLHKTAASSINFSNINIDTFKNAIAYEVKLSPDWKTFLVKSYNKNNYAYNTYYFQRNDNDSIFKFNRELNSKIATGKLLTMPYLNNQTCFVNNNNLLSFKEGTTEDTLSFWKKFDTVANLNDLNLLIKKISQLTDTSVEKNDLINVDEINDITYLKKVLFTARIKDTRLLSKESLLNVKNIYRRLTELDTTNYLKIYRTTSRNYFTYYSDTTDYIRDLKQVTNIEDVLLKTAKNDSLKNDLSSDYWNLSWYLILTKNFDNVVNMTTKGIALNSKNNGINTNLALGYLLTGQCEKADSVYKKFKGLSYNSDNRKFTGSFLQDLDDLEEINIITPNNKEIYSHVQKIRQFLKGETNTLSCK